MRWSTRSVLKEDERRFTPWTSRSRARLSSLASVGNITAFGCTVVSITTQARSEGIIRPGRHRQALLQQRLELLLPHPLAPTRQRRTVEHQRMLEKLLAAEVLEVRVLHPAIVQTLVGKVVGVLEDR